jgi:hypothetical protein
MDVDEVGQIARFRIDLLQLGEQAHRPLAQIVEDQVIDARHAEQLRHRYGAVDRRPGGTADLDDFPRHGQLVRTATATAAGTGTGNSSNCCAMPLAPGSSRGDLLRPPAMESFTT